ncbi:WD repeat-containing protein 34 isoform X2 [Dunckerocampus dactyliophorus]|uniref:WD repeat-containing protein 34 isoform X2 n=1 Tax=Dunckerocampus dactyliophorus TaxID=161453 RepID=UPI002405544C|nr:WD repeat-containing protein 34 isoform X2 [Dunckerocampus dactyliophorus]
MFSDEAQVPVSIPSSWKKCQQLTQESRGCQTRVIDSAEAGFQTVSCVTSATQTELQDQVTTRFLQDPHDELCSPGLKDFLRRVEVPVIRELVRNAKSHAFDGFQVNWEERNQMVVCLHQLEHPKAVERDLPVTSVSWSCTGASVVCAYGRMAAGDWSDDKSYVCMWNLDHRGLNPKQADLVIHVTTAVTSLCCHPKQPALIAGTSPPPLPFIATSYYYRLTGFDGGVNVCAAVAAGGLYSGEVVVWDTSQTTDPVLAQTAMSADSHREPVCQVTWVPLRDKGELGVLSACSGGRLLLWTVNSEQGRCVLKAAFAVVQHQLPSNSSSFKVQGTITVGVTSMDLSAWDPDTLIVGSESGLLLRCSLSSQTPAAVTSPNQSVPLRAPVVFSFRPSSGPVHSIHCSPFHRNLFLSAGTDGLAHLHSLLQTNPLLSLRVSDTYVFKVQWSPSRPLLFAAATGQGEVQIFDLSGRSLRPAASIGQGGVGKAATCLAFNNQHSGLLAVGRSDGMVGVWKLSTDLTEQKPTETHLLEQIANQVAE